MKKTVLSLSLLSLLCVSAAFAQTSVATAPVGFITVPVAGGTQASPVLSPISPTLTNPIAFQGIVASVSGTTITVTGASFSNGQYSGTNANSGANPEQTYYAEIFSSTQAGVLSDITGTGTATITTAQDLSSIITAGESIAIRQHVTINQFLGATNTYLQGGTSASTADEVLIYSGSSQTSYFYYTGTPRLSLSDAGWYDEVGNPAGGVTIAPSEGVVIKRKAAGAVFIVSTGTVKTGNTIFPIVNNLNVEGTLSAQGLTLDTSGLYTGTSGGVTGGTSASTADEVTIYTLPSPYTTPSQVNYFYYTGTPRLSYSDAGWYDEVGDPSGSVSLPPGCALVVNRKGGGAFNWSLPAPSSF